MVTSYASFSDSLKTPNIELPGLIEHRLKFSNISELKLRMLGEKFLKTYEILNQRVLLQMDMRKFEIIDGKICTANKRTLYIQSILNGVVCTKVLEDAHDEDTVALQKILTTNIPEPDPTGCFRAAEILKRIKQFVLKTAPLLEHPELFEWRLDVSNYTQDELNEVRVQLMERGFSVSTFLPQQIKIEDIRRKIKLSSTQYLCIGIPPQSGSIEATDKKFSVYQIYQTWGRIQEKKSFAPTQQSVEYIIRGMNHELTLIAKESTLATIYPVDTACLNEQERTLLIEKLYIAGYAAYRDKPYFLVSERDGPVYYMHNINIQASSSEG